jgi:nickel/cobalt transporter (NicO) family protein
MGSIVLSFIHALIPNHWVPLIALSKTEKWTKKETFLATFITGFSHTLSTIIIGIVVGFLGIKLAKSFELLTEIAAPIILLVIGLVYVIIDLVGSGRHGHHHGHHHVHHYDHTHFNPKELSYKPKKTKSAIIISISIAMFLTPCIEIEAYYFQASTIGWIGILIVSSVYLLITLTIMFSLVYLGLIGINRFKSHYLEHHERRITGVVLIMIALIAILIEF